jgi:hypothetical protein
VARHVIVPERSRLDLAARPALPGVRLVAERLAGTIDLDVPVAAGPPRPGGIGPCVGRGALDLWIRVLVEDGGRADGVPAWLRSGDAVAVGGEVEEVRGDGDGRLEVRTRLRVDDRTVLFTGAGRVGPIGGGARPVGSGGPAAGGGLEAVGVTIVDPRTLGFGLSPLVTHVIHARWRLLLVLAS